MSWSVSTPIRTTLPVASVTYWRNQIRALFVGSYTAIWSQQNRTPGRLGILGKAVKGSFGVKVETGWWANAANQLPVAKRNPLSVRAAVGSHTTDRCSASVAL